MATPPSLNRDVVVRTALQLMDERGVDWLSMRKLAGELGVSAQALYWYFPSKEALCRAVVAAAGDELGTLPLGAGDAIDRLRRHLRGLRDHWRAHPCVITLGQRLPPTAAGAVAAQGVELLEELGFKGEVALDRYRALVWVVLGFVYVEHGVSQSAHHERADDSGDRYLVHLAGSDAPASALDTEALFEQVLATTLTGLRTELGGAP